MEEKRKVEGGTEIRAKGSHKEKWGERLRE